MKMRDRLNKVVVAPTLLLLVGCSARRVDLTREPAGCELKADAVCASAFENYLTAEVMRAVESPPSQRPHVMPLVVPVKLPGGELAAEVDCYVNVKPEGFFAGSRTRRNSA
jgi:hypothetical protein